MRRIQSVDVLRVAAVISVIAIHTTSLELLKNSLITAPANNFYQYFFVVINQASRFAVPFFFTVSGYFYAKKVEKAGQVLPTTYAMLKRLIFIFLFWSAIYVFPYDLSRIFGDGGLELVRRINWKIEHIVNNPVYFLFEGTQGHLWFMVSLGFAVLITAIFIQYFSIGPLIVLSLLLYGFGLLAQSYSATDFGVHIKFNTIKGPFFSTIFFVTGYLLSKFKTTKNFLKFGALIAIVGFIMHFSEIAYLYKTYKIHPARHNYVIGTYFMGLGVSMLALSDHKMLKIESLSKIGKYTLGIYAIHYIFIEALLGINKHVSGMLWGIGSTFLVFIVSAGATVFLSRFKLLKRFFV